MRISGQDLSNKFHVWSFEKPFKKSYSPYNKKKAVFHSSDTPKEYFRDIFQSSIHPIFTVVDTFS